MGTAVCYCYKAAPREFTSTQTLPFFQSFLALAVAFKAPVPILFSPSTDLRDIPSIALAMQYSYPTDISFTPRTPPQSNTTTTVHGSSYIDGIHCELRKPVVLIDWSQSKAQIIEMFMEEVLDAPATSNRVGVFRIESRSLPGCDINISRPHGGDITVEDVIMGISTHLQQPLAEKNLDRLQHFDPQIFQDAEVRRRMRTGEESITKADMCWIDLLPEEERTFKGLSAEKSSSTDRVTRRILKVSP